MRLRFLAGTLAVLSVFAAVNYHAYGGFFTADDLDNLVNTQLPGIDMFTQGLISPYYDAFNFRPVGHVTYRWLQAASSMNFPVFVGFVQVMHLVNTALLVVWLRRRELPLSACLGAAVTFLFHPALFAAFWKPMFLFDVWSAFFALSTLLLYPTRVWPAGVVTFWCAYKSKEVAIFLPMVLVLFHGWSWRLLPFLAIAANFGLQAMRINSARNDAYTLRYSFAALATSVPFYLKAAVGLPLAALAAFAGSRDKRILQGVAGFVLLLIPLLLLPGRMIDVYLYVPWIPVSVAIAAALARVPPRWIAALCLLWCGFTYTRLREFRGQELARAATAKRFFGAAQDYYRAHPIKDARVRYTEIRGGLEPWGFEAAIRLASNRLTLQMEPANATNTALPSLVLPE